MDVASRLRGKTGAGRSRRRARTPKRMIALAGAIAFVVIAGQAGARPATSATTVRPSVLSAIDGTSPGNAWAVGSTIVGTGIKTLIEHWNGTSWQIHRSPNVGKGNNFLTGVAA